MNGKRSYADKRLKIELEDVNLNTPVFAGTDFLNDYITSVSTESKGGDFVASVFAIDQDATLLYNEVNTITLACFIQSDILDNN